MTETKATITATASAFKHLIIQSALDESGGDPPWVHSDIYLDIGDGVVDVLIASGGGSVYTYCSYDVGYFEDVEGSCVAMLDVQPTLDRLDVADGGERMAFEFRGPDDGEQAEELVAKGALEMSVTLPAADKAMDKVPTDFTSRWDDDQRLLSPSGNPHQTYIDTTVDSVHKVIEAVDLHDDIDYYPITVKDGAFFLDVGDKLGSLSGELAAENVDGPDLHNWYGPGFEAVFSKTMSGSVQLQTTPGENGGHPMAVVQEADDYVLRHVLVEVNPA